MSSRNVRRLYAAAHALGLTSILNRLRDGQRVISYHNVLPDELERSTTRDGNTISVSALRMHLTEAKKVLPPSVVPAEPGTFLVTFDDGNLNNFECAVPVLEELGIKAYFFVPLDTAKTGEATWVDQVHLWCSWAPAGTPFPGGVHGNLESDDPQARAAAFRHLLEIGSQSRRVRSEMIRAIEEWRSGGCTAPSELLRLRYSAMTASQLETLKQMGHKVGCHSLTHDRLSSLDAEELEEDFRVTKAEVGRTYNTDTYCYPFGGRGDVAPRVVDACQRAGFSCAFINDRSVGFDGGSFTLPRFTLEEIDDQAVVHARLSGLDQVIKAALRGMGLPERGFRY